MSASERPAKRARLHVDADANAKRAQSDDDAEPSAVHSHALDDVAAYAGSPLAFSRPKMLTSFSFSTSREVLLGPRAEESRSHYRPPPLGADLNRGFDDCVWRDETDVEGLDALLEACVRTCALVRELRPPA